MFYFKNLIGPTVKIITFGYVKNIQFIYLHLKKNYGLKNVQNKKNLLDYGNLKLLMMENKDYGLYANAAMVDAKFKSKLIRFKNLIPTETYCCEYWPNEYMIFQLNQQLYINYCDYNHSKAGTKGAVISLCNLSWRLDKLDGKKIRVATDREKYWLSEAIKQYTIIPFNDTQQKKLRLWKLQLHR